MSEIKKNLILLMFLVCHLTSCASFHKPIITCDGINGCKSSKEDSVSDVINSLGSVTDIVNINKQ